MPETKMVSMKQTKAEIKKDNSPMEVGGNRDPFPWGLKVDLNNVSIKKLGVDVSKYVVGEEVTIIAKSKIERLSQAANSTGGENQSMTLQITNLQLKQGNSKPNKLSQTKTSASVEKDLDAMGLIG